MYNNENKGNNKTGIVVNKGMILPGDQSKVMEWGASQNVMEWGTLSQCYAVKMLWYQWPNQTVMVLLAQSKCYDTRAQVQMLWYDGNS